MNLVLARRSHISTPTRTNLPQSLTQAQRNYFGAHTYQRADDPSGAFVYTDWQAKTAEALKASKPAVLVSNRKPRRRQRAQAHVDCLNQMLSYSF